MLPSFLLDPVLLVSDAAESHHSLQAMHIQCNLCLVKHRAGMQQHMAEQILSSHLTAYQCISICISHRVRTLLEGLAVL